MLPRYKRLVRTTLRGLAGDLPRVGVYVISYLGKVLYVEQSVDVEVRLAQHLRAGEWDDFGGWMSKVRDDWHNVRLDVLEPPDEGNQRKWLAEVEGALVREFSPLFGQERKRSNGKADHAYIV